MTCPLCNEEIQDGRDELIITWYEPRRWWVVTHKRDGDGYCGKADFDGGITAGLLEASRQLA